MRISDVSKTNHSDWWKKKQEKQGTMTTGQNYRKAVVIGQNCKVAKNSKWLVKFVRIVAITKFWRD